MYKYMLNVMLHPTTAYYAADSLLSKNKNKML